MEARIYFVNSICLPLLLLDVMLGI